MSVIEELNQTKNALIEIKEFKVNCKLPLSVIKQILKREICENLSKIKYIGPDRQYKNYRFLYGECQVCSKIAQCNSMMDAEKLKYFFRCFEHGDDPEDPLYPAADIIVPHSDILKINFKTSMYFNNLGIF